MKLEPIDTSTTAGKAEVMRLAAEGREVRWRFNGDAQWLKGCGDDWDWKSCQYAIVAEPVKADELWVAFSTEGFMAGYRRSKYPGFVRYVRADD